MNSLPPATIWHFFFVIFENATDKYPGVVVPISKIDRLLTTCIQLLRDLAWSLPEPPIGKPVKLSWRKDH